jgi:hypothetical protein
MNRHIHTHTLHLTPQNRWIHFDFTLPNDAAKIIGIQTAIGKNNNALPTLTPNGNFLMERQIVTGELRMQTAGTSNWFYAETLADDDEHISMADCSQTGFAPQEPTHNSKKFPQPVEVQLSSNVINGFYKELLQDNNSDDFSYEVSIYVWYAINEKT